jgi:hypothetical protein
MRCIEPRRALLSPSIRVQKTAPTLPLAGYQLNSEAELLSVPAGRALEWPTGHRHSRGADSAPSSWPRAVLTVPAKELLSRDASA